MIKIVVVGGGGHGSVVLDALLLSKEFEPVGVTDANPELRGHELLGIEVFGDDGVLAELRSRGVTAAALGLGDNARRRALYERLRELDLVFPPVIHPSAAVSSHAEIQQAAVVMPMAAVNAGTIVGTGAVVNTRAAVDHDCRLGDFSQVAPGASLGGHVSVGEEALVGIGASVLPGTTIGPRAVVGAGAVVLTDIPGEQVWVGNPARRLR